MSILLFVFIDFLKGYLSTCFGVCTYSESLFHYHYRTQKIGTYFKFGERKSTLITKG